MSNLSAAEILNGYHDSVNYIQHHLNQLSETDPSHLAAWTQLRLFVVNETDKVCAEKIRSGREDIFAGYSNVYEKFANLWKTLEPDIKQNVFPDNTDHIINDGTRDNLVKSIFNRLIEELTGDIPGNKLLYIYDKKRLRSSAYELIHYLTNLRQRLDESEPISSQAMLTHLVKVESRQRMRPDRSIFFPDKIQEYLTGLAYEELASNEWEVLRDASYRSWLGEVWGQFLGKVNLLNIAPFQWKCFKSILNDALVKNPSSAEQEPVMITADTGFGKTEAFIFPILFFALINLVRQSIQNKGPDAILLYPRIDLCNDQLERCLWYAYNLRIIVENHPATNSYINHPLPNPFRITIAHSGLNRLEDNRMPFKVDCPICKSENIPGKILLRRIPGFGYNVKPFCNTNEEHQVEKYLGLSLNKYTKYFSIAITTVDTLHRRLMDHHGIESLWRNRRVLPRFIVLDEIHVYDGQQGTHVANLCRRLKTYLKFLPPSQLTPHKTDNPLPPIFIGSSATVGNPLSVAGHFFGIQEKKIKERAFVPEDYEKKPFGNEYIILLKTPPHRMVNLPRGGDLAPRFVSEQATLLQSLMALWHCMPKTENKYRILTFVDSIDSVWRITKNLHDAESRKTRRNRIDRPPLYLFRLPSGRPRNLEITQGGDFCPQRNENTCLSPPHHFFQTCETYNSGECWWTMLSSPEVFNRSMRVLANASGQRKEPEHTDRSLDDWDCLITTSTLEVGFDHPELIATAQFMAPPNPASFQQRKGRGGRGPQDTPLSLVVLTNSSGDLFAFRNEQKFFFPTDKDLEIKIDAQNPYVRNQHVLSAFFDYFSWRGITQNSLELYKNSDINMMIGWIDNPNENISTEIIQWLMEIYSPDGLNENDCRKLFANTYAQLKKSVVYLSSTLTSRSVYTSIDLFKRNQIPADWLFEIRQKLKASPDDKMEQKTLLILESAQSYIASQPDRNYLHPPEYFSNLPVDSDGKPIEGQNTIPTSFVPTPIGGYVNVCLKGQHERIVKEPLLQILSSFLPGGFKNRWNFRLWYGDWIPVQGKPGFADISEICRSSHHIGVLSDFISSGSVPFTLQGWENAELIEPLRIDVNSEQMYFRLDPGGTRVVVGESEPGGDKLLRDPSSTIQSYDLLIIPEKAKQKNVTLMENSLAIQNGSYGVLSVFRLFYSNIVTAYLENRNTRGMTVRFWDQDKQKNVIPTARLNSQGIMVEGFLSKPKLSKLKEQLKKTNMLHEHYWRNIYRNMWRSLILRNDVNNLELPNSFACYSLLQALKFIEYRIKVNNLESLKNQDASSIQTIIDESKRLCSELDIGLFGDGSIENTLSGVWEDFVSKILVPAEETLQEEFAESFSRSVGSIITRDIAYKTNTNLDMLEVSCEIFPNDSEIKFTTYIYDQLQGGSGTVLSFLEKIKWQLSIDEIIQNHNKCLTSQSEQEVLKVLNDETYNADILFTLVQSETGITDKDFLPESVSKLRRLLASPEITSFYQGVADNYFYLKELLNRVPTSFELAITLLERPISDPRGLELTKRFKKVSGGIAELIPRTEEILPLCNGTCPDCLGDSRFSINQGDISIPDRHLLMIDKK